ncbi:Glu/Leu/Phe/Val dehydrogenase [Candidatus Micrarchaeota archaeon]|nr:Glu/Leu/Phe/Val dehydrogenase [Candidatus Micrarchaeota archaeon]
MGDENECAFAKAQLKKLEKCLKLSESEFNLLKKPKRSLAFTIPLKMDSGEIVFLNSYRVQYNDALGPTKGGIRFHSEVNLEEAKTLAFLMALKCALFELPYGGAKGGVEVNPRALSKAELERLSRGFVREIHNFIGPDLDIPAPDINTDEQVMAWMFDEYSKIKGRLAPGVFTGKPLALGGSKGRDVATAMGGAYILRLLEAMDELNPCELRLAIQGFGNAGLNAARILCERGYKIIALSNSRQGIYNKQGLDIPFIISNYRERWFPEMEGVEPISNNELLELDCDVLIPAALSNQITAENAERVKARIVVELANAPTAPEADDILFRNGVKVLPDILANAGGVIVSYFEWIQNSSNEYWSEQKVFERLEKTMENAFYQIVRTSQQEKCDYRTASYIIAVMNILNAERLRGSL